MTQLIILLDIIQKDTKKNDMNLYFKSSRISTTNFFAKVVNG